MAIDRAQIRGLLAEARSLRDGGRTGDAFELLRRAQSAAPDDPRVWHDMAILLHKARERRDALALFAHAHQAFAIAEALADRPKHKRQARSMMAETALHAGVVAVEMGEVEVGLDWLRLSTLLYPGNRGSPAWAALGSALYMTGQPQDGCLAHDKALQTASADPDPAVRFNCALVRLLRGLPGAWGEYEARLKIGLRPHRDPATLPPKWTGRPPGKILVQSEQGLGDSIMMERYLQHLPGCVISCQPELVGWMRGRGHDAISNTDPLPAGLTHHIYAMSLPGIFGIIPPDGPRIDGKVPPRPERSPKVGICTAGNPDHSNDRDRSMPRWLADSLKVGRSVDHPWTSLDYVDLNPKDMSETAAVIAGLDVVVSVDTAVLHLAGTLGVPTIGLIPTAPEWRWGLSGDSTPWYPGMQLVRRKHTADWVMAINETRHRIDQMFQGGRNGRPLADQP